MKNDSKQLWKLLKSWLQTGSNETGRVQFNDKIIEDESEIARLFNEHFVNSVMDIHKSIPQCNEPEQIKNIEQTRKRFVFQPIDIQTLQRICFKLKGASGLDVVNGKVIRDCLSVTGDALPNIINDSLITGQFSNTWKESIVIPIPKISGTIIAEEVRPINMLNTLENNLELLVKEQLVQYLKENNLLVPEQSEYRESHSWETALNLVLKKWKTY